MGPGFHRGVRRTSKDSGGEQAELRQRKLNAATGSSPYTTPPPVYAIAFAVCGAKRLVQCLLLIIRWFKVIAKVAAAWQGLQPEQVEWLVRWHIWWEGSGEAVRFTLPFAKCLSELNCKVFAIGVDAAAVQSDFAELWHINYAIFKQQAISEFSPLRAWLVRAVPVPSWRKQIHIIWHSWNSLCSARKFEWAAGSK